MNFCHNNARVRADYTKMAQSHRDVAPVFTEEEMALKREMEVVDFRLANMLDIGLLGLIMSETTQGDFSVYLWGQAVFTILVLREPVQSPAFLYLDASDVASIVHSVPSAHAWAEAQLEVRPKFSQEKPVYAPPVEHVVAERPLQELRREDFGRFMQMGFHRVAQVLARFPETERAFVDYTPKVMQEDFDRLRLLDFRGVCAILDTTGRGNRSITQWAIAAMSALFHLNLFKRKAASAAVPRVNALGTRNIQLILDHFAGHAAVENWGRPLLVQTKRHEHALDVKKAGALLLGAVRDNNELLLCELVAVFGFSLLTVPFRHLSYNIYEVDPNMLSVQRIMTAKKSERMQQLLSGRSNGYEDRVFFYSHDKTGSDGDTVLHIINRLSIPLGACIQKLCTPKQFTALCAMNNGKGVNALYSEEGPKLSRSRKNPRF